MRRIANTLFFIFLTGFVLALTPGLSAAQSYAVDSSLPEYKPTDLENNFLTSVGSDSMGGLVDAAAAESSHSGSE